MLTETRTTRTVAPFSAEDVRLRAVTLCGPRGQAADFGDHVIEPRLGIAKSHKPAAVLIPLVERGDALSVLLTLRTAHLSTHAGQIAFPGGRIDPEDAGPVDAALREAEEEIALDRQHVEVLGELDPYLSRTGYIITGVLALVRPDFELTLNPHEVDDCFEVPFDFLMTPDSHKREIRQFNGADRAFYSMQFQDRYIWGVTAGIIRQLYHCLYQPGEIAGQA